MAKVLFLQQNLCPGENYSSNGIVCPWALQDLSVPVTELCKRPSKVLNRLWLLQDLRQDSQKLKASLRRAALDVTCCSGSTEADELERAAYVCRKHEHAKKNRNEELART